MTFDVLSLFVGLLIGAGSCLLLLRPTLVGLRERIRQKEEEQVFLEQAQVRLVEVFKAASSDALKASNESFLQLATTHLDKYQETARLDLQQRHDALGSLVKPIQESLEKVDVKVLELEKAREAAYVRLDEQLKNLVTSELQLKTETARLVEALKKPSVRGRWGEIQLRRVVELAGMTEHCDFSEQVSVASESGGSLRPDLVIRLPGLKTIVVDSKAPLQAYLEALEVIDESQRRAKFFEHAAQVKAHLSQLSQKAYWEKLQETPEFVVLFLPGEAFFSVALEHDPSLIEFGIERKVILATPTTLIALLRAVAYGWRQEALAENAQQISDLGRELYARLVTLGGHFSDLRKGLARAVESFNSAAASLESRVFVSARKLQELGTGTGSEIPNLGRIDSTPREIQVVEFTPPETN